MKHITEKEIISELQLALTNRNGMVIVDYENPQVSYGFADKPDFEYCQKYGIETINGGRMGGTFVINKGDVGFGYVAKGLDNSVMNKVYHKFTEYLKSKGLNAIAQDNDILVDGYKVFGCASYHFINQDVTHITCHFTMSVDLELINAICTKPMNKIPKGLSEYGISREEIVDFIKSNLGG